MRKLYRLLNLYYSPPCEYIFLCFLLILPILHINFLFTLPIHCCSAVLPTIRSCPNISSVVRSFGMLLSLLYFPRNCITSNQSFYFYAFTTLKAYQNKRTSPVYPKNMKNDKKSKCPTFFGKLCYNIPKYYFERR